MVMIDMRISSARSRSTDALAAERRDRSLLRAGGALFRSTEIRHSVKLEGIHEIVKGQKKRAGECRTRRNVYLRRPGRPAFLLPISLPWAFIPLLVTLGFILRFKRDTCGSKVSKSL